MESSFSQCSTIIVTTPYTGYNQRQTCQSTNDDGINKGTGHGNKTLFCRPFSFRSSCYDGRTTQASFIRINTTSNTTTHCQHHCRTKKTASCRSTGKGTVQNKLNSGNNLVREHTKDGNSGDDIQHCHKRYNLTCYIGNGLQATNNDESNKYGKHACSIKHRQIKGHIQNRSNCIHLGKGTGA